MTEVVVVGGGIAGTTIAWELARRGTSRDAVRAGIARRGRVRAQHRDAAASDRARRGGDARASVASYRELAADFGWTPREELLLARDAGAVAGRGGRRRAVIGGRDGGVTATSCARRIPAFGPDVLGGQVFAGAATVEPERRRARSPRRRASAGARIRTGVRVGAVARGRRAHRRRAGRRRRGRRSPPGRGSRTSCASPVKAGRGWLLQRRAAATSRGSSRRSRGRIRRCSGARRSRCRSPRSPPGDVDVPVGECALLCPLPGGDGLLGASLSTSLRDAVEGVRRAAADRRARPRGRAGAAHADRPRVVGAAADDAGRAPVAGRSDGV